MLSYDDKIGPSLFRYLSAPQLACGEGESIDLLIFGKARALRELQRNHDARRGSEALPFVVLRVTRSEIGPLVRDRAIELVEKDETYASVLKPVDTYQPQNADIYDRYKKEVLRELNGEGIRIMVQDTGLSPHPSFAKLPRVIDCTDENVTRDYIGHGEAIVSQMISGGRYPGLVREARITMARIFDRKGSTRLSWIVQACAAAVEEGVHIVSMSYGGPMPHPVIELAMKRLDAEGICLFAAAGNSGPAEGTIGYPAGYKEVMAIGAVDKKGRLASFSSRGRPGQQVLKPDLVLEGVNVVMAASPDGSMGRPVEPGYVTASGTSFACPIGACLAAMILQARGVGTPPQRVRELLYQSALK